MIYGEVWSLSAQVNVDYNTVKRVALECERQGFWVGSIIGKKRMFEKKNIGKKAINCSTTGRKSIIGNMIIICFQKTKFAYNRKT